ncbi:MAG: hypothetical protein NC830_04695 [Candidatus Omnitrophica bacterium]|nr:hypothetical protein [Candidatus Omnitrophota bacterium]
MFFSPLFKEGMGEIFQLFSTAKIPLAPPLKRGKWRGSKEGLGEIFQLFSTPKIPLNPLLQQEKKLIPKSPWFFSKWEEEKKRKNNGNKKG